MPTLRLRPAGDGGPLPGVRRVAGGGGGDWVMRRQRVGWLWMIFTVIAAATVVLSLVVAYLIRPRGNRTDTYYHRTEGGRYYKVTVYPDSVAVGRSTRTLHDADISSPSAPPVTWGHSTGPLPRGWRCRRNQRGTGWGSITGPTACGSSMRMAIWFRSGPGSFRNGSCCWSSRFRRSRGRRR